MKNAFLAAALFGALALTSVFAADLPPCRVGMHVERVSPLNYGAKILAFDAKKGTYRVKDDRSGLEDWVTAYSLRNSCKGEEAKPIDLAYFVGDWSLFVGPAPHHEVIGDKRYLVVGPGAKAPPLSIKRDGRYVWTIDSRTKVEGRWRELAPNERKSGTKGPAIVLLKGEDGKDWQVSNRGANSANNRDAINIDRMDMGLSYQGTRMP